MKDAPDICNDDKMIGVEVIQAIADEDAREQSKAAKDFLRNIDNNNHTTKKSESKDKDGAENSSDDEECIEPITYDDEKKLFQYDLAKKLDKLPSYKKKGYQIMRLFVFYNEIPIPVKLEQYKECFEEVLDKYDDKYEVIYLGWPSGLITHDVKEKYISVKKIESADYNKLQYDARMQVEHASEKQG